MVIQAVIVSIYIWRYGERIHTDEKRRKSACANREVCREIGAHCSPVKERIERG
jgi:hypothetical protein